MNILFLSFLVPFPVNRGDQRRIMAALTSLSAKHAVTLVCLSEEEPDAAALAALSRICVRVEVVHLSRLRKRLNQVVSLGRRCPLRVSACRSGELARRVRQHLDSRVYDLIYAFDARMAPYVSQGKGATTLLDFCDAYSLYYERAARIERNSLMRLILRAERRRMQAYERKLVAEMDSCVICSDLDQAAVIVHATRDNVHVIPNTIEVSAYEHGQTQVEPHSIVYLGNMGLKANIDAICHFASAIFPTILVEVPDARLYIVGPGATPTVRNLARQDGRIRVMGRIEDLTGFLAQCEVFVCPLRIGAGTRIKILEAMAIGLPVVTTSLGCEGIGITPGRQMIVIDDDLGFAAGVVRVLGDRPLREDLSREALAFVRARHDSAIVGRQLDRLLDTLCPTAG